MLPKTHNNVNFRIINTTKRLFYAINVYFLQQYKNSKFVLSLTFRRKRLIKTIFIIQQGTNKN